MYVCMYVCTLVCKYVSVCVCGGGNERIREVNYNMHQVYTQVNAHIHMHMYAHICTYA